MMNSLRYLFYRNRHNIAVFVLLNTACAVCIGLVVARVAYTDNGQHLGLIWNLFLAWIPFMLAYLAHTISWQRLAVYLVIPVVALLWLLFFPNAPYMLTDLQDLSRRSIGAPLWYDVIIVVWCSWTAMLLGIVSLYLMQDIVMRTFGRTVGWIFVFVISALSSFGIYLGRFVRLNSWDILNNPKETAQTILGLVVEPSRRLTAFTLAYTSFFLFVYLMLYSFSRMLREQDIKLKETPEQLASTQKNHVQK
jgi:uncharacterized membrane protein